tara:strand:+ start:595 stop:891 length:297 start_codon:yes stop_codon:yes gene_type:complete
MMNIILEANMTRYDLLTGEYEDVHYGQTMCCFTWLKSGRGGLTFTWPKGSNLYADYVVEKSGINRADLTGILSAIKGRFPGTVGEMMGFDDSYMCQGV